MKNSPISERKVVERKQRKIRKKLEEYQITPNKETKSCISRMKLQFDKTQPSIKDIWGPEREKKKETLGGPGTFFAKNDGQ